MQSLASIVKAAQPVLNWFQKTDSVKPSPERMKRTILLFLFAVCTGLSGCEKRSSPLNDFSSDGCSLFPDRSLISEEDWCECCVTHDLSYWQGGTEEERELADRELRQCVLKKTGDEGLAELMYQGVRFGGSPYFYNWYRWGYGWEYGRAYQSLTQQEEKLVKKKLSAYFDTGSASVCGDELIRKKSQDF